MPPTTKPTGGDHRRPRALLLIVAYAALCGVPVWWRTTSVPRPPLPHGRMRALGERLAGSAGASGSAAAATLPVRLDVYVAGGDVAPQIEPLVKQALAGLQTARLDVAVRPLPEALSAGRVGSLSSDEAADALLLEALGTRPLEAGSYALVVVPQQQQQKQGEAEAETPPPPPPPSLTVGKHRHAWAALPAALWGEKSSTTPLAAAVAEAAALAVRHAFGLWAQEDSHHHAQAPPPELASSPLFSPGGLVLSFSLVNGDVPPSGAGASSDSSPPSVCPAGYTWDFAALERARLAPLLGALRAAAGGGPATIGAESAVLQLSPAGAEGAWRVLGGGDDEDREVEEEKEEEEDDGYEDVPSAEEDEAAAAASATKKRRRQEQRRLKAKTGSGLGAFVLSREQLPSFADSEWPFESGRGVLSSAATMHRAAARRGRRRGGGPAPNSATTTIAPEERSWARERDRSAALLAPHVLHFVTFVPKPGQRPLLVEEAAAAIRRAVGGGGGNGAGNTTNLFASTNVDPAVNGYWIPSWGGVLIWNPPEQGAAATATPPPPRVCPLPDAAAAAVTRAFATQLRALLGLPFHGTRPTSPPALVKAVRLLPSPDTGLAKWEADALSRARVRVGAASAARTLRALSEVVAELPNLGMPDLIGAQVNAALDAAEGALEACARGDYKSAALAASAAAAAADAAFLHPSVLSQLNFPDSHKLGVYMPYFLPASVPLVQGLAREAKRWLRRWKRARRRRKEGERGGGGGGAAAAAVVGAGAAAAAGATAASTPARRSKRQNQD